MSRRILVTSALPYANGHIHIGHLLEYIQTDIWVRFQKLRGERCLFICADDTHGTAIMIRARQEGRSEEEVIAEMRLAHLQDFTTFDVQFDNYGSTHSPENQELCTEIWQAVVAAGLVTERPVEQLYDAVEETFLADRFVKGTCPVCKSSDQYGDHCDKCLSNYTPKELIDPRSTLSGEVPQLRTAPHKFIQLEKLHGFLEEWSQSGKHLQSEIANYLKGHFLGQELRDWDVTRPPKYFGFEVPDFPGHSWYVWFDAPIGYIASSLEWCRRHGENLDDWWRNPNTEIHHFIGKDITYFHTLFWPGILKTARFNLPARVHVHGFLTVGGEKMSKSKGTFIRARAFADHLDPQSLRYFIASKTGPKVDDLDLDFSEFKAKVDSDVVGKVVNIASRCARFVAGQTLCEAYPDDGGLFAQGAAQGEAIAAAYENRDFGSAIRIMMTLADAANQFVETREPWKLKKDPGRQQELRDACTIALNLFRQVVVYLTPVLPRLSHDTGRLLSVPITTWSDAHTPLTGALVAEYQHLFQRIDSEKVQKMIDASKEDSTGQPTVPNPSPDGSEALAKEPLLTDHISIDDFTKVDMRVARVLEANHVAGADKLLQLTLSLGGDVRRNVFAGIKSCYAPEQLVGRLVICCANLAPRKMRFGVSEGMVLACGPGGQEIFLLNPDSGAQPGMRVH